MAKDLLNLKDFVSRKKVIFWDFDGTLIDSEPIYFKLFQSAFSLAEIDISEDFFYDEISFRGLKAHSLLERHNKSDLAPVVLASLNDAISSHVSNNHFRIFPESAFILDCLSNFGLKNYVVSNNTRHVITHILRGAGVLHYFKNIVAKEPGRASKPAPDPFLAALTMSCFKREDALIFEDTETGLISSKAAQIDAILLSTPSNYGLGTSLPVVARMSHDRCLKALTAAE